MTEQEYIILSNRVKISNAITILNDTLSGKDYGIDQNLIASSLISLDKIESELRRMTVVEIDKEIKGTLGDNSNHASEKILMRID